MKRLVLSASVLDGVIAEFKSACRDLDFQYEFSDDPRAYRKGKEAWGKCWSFVDKVPVDIFVKYWNEAVTREDKSGRHLVTVEQVEKGLEKSERERLWREEEERAKAEKAKLDKASESDPRTLKGKVNSLWWLGKLLQDYKCTVKASLNEEVPRLFISYTKYPMSWILNHFGFVLVKKGNVVRAYSDGKGTNNLCKGVTYLKVTERDGGTYMWLSEI